jgi:hypothetical protein
LNGRIVRATNGVDDGVDVLTCDAILHVELTLADPSTPIPGNIVPALMGLRTHKVSVSLDTPYMTML